MKKQYVHSKINKTAFDSMKQTGMDCETVIKEISDNGAGSGSPLLCYIARTNQDDHSKLDLSIADWGAGLAPKEFGRLISFGHDSSAEGNDFCQYGIGGTLAILKALEKSNSYQFASHVAGGSWYAMNATKTLKQTMPVEELPGMPVIDSKGWNEVVATHGEPSTIVTIKGIEKKFAAAMVGTRKRVINAEQFREAVISTISLFYRGLLMRDPMTNKPKLEVIVVDVSRRGFSGNVYVQPATLPFSDTKTENFTVYSGKETGYDVKVTYGRINKEARETAIFGMPMTKAFEISEAGQGCHLFVGGKEICKIPFNNIYSEASKAAPSHPRFNQVGMVVDLPMEVRDSLSLKFDKSAIDETTRFVQNLYKELRRRVNIKPYLNDTVSTTRDMRNKYMSFLSMQPGRDWECQPCMAVLGGREFTDLYCRDKNSGYGLIVKFVATSSNNPSIKDARELRYAQAYMVDSGFRVDELVLISKKDNTCLRKALEADKFRLVNKETGVMYDGGITFKTAADFGWSI